MYEDGAQLPSVANRALIGLASSSSALSFALIYPIPEALAQPKGLSFPINSRLFLAIPLVFPLYFSFNIFLCVCVVFFLKYNFFTVLS